MTSSGQPNYVNWRQGPDYNIKWKAKLLSSFTIVYIYYKSISRFAYKGTTKAKYMYKKNSQTTV